TLRKEGTADSKFGVRIEAGRRTLETRTLVATTADTPAAPRAAAAPAVLVVFSEPGGAVVYLDDEAIGTTDALSGRLVKSGVAPGTHTLRISAAEHAESTQEVVLAASGPTTVRAKLVARGTPARGLAPAAVAVAV